MTFLPSQVSSTATSRRKSGEVTTTMGQKSHNSVFVNGRRKFVVASSSPSSSPSSSQLRKGTMTLVVAATVICVLWVGAVVAIIPEWGLWKSSNEGKGSRGDERQLTDIPQEKQVKEVEKTEQIDKYLPPKPIPKQPERKHSISHRKGGSDVVEDDDGKSSSDLGREKHLEALTTQSKHEGTKTSFQVTGVMSGIPVDKCSFRKYTPDRFYGLSQPLKSQPPFLASAQYIRGIPPQILNKKEADATPDQTPPKKVCIDTSEWEDVKQDRWPFTDGHNPSLASLAPHPHGISDHETSSQRLNLTSVPALVQLYGGENPSERLADLYLGVIVVGDGQCKWKMTDEQVNQYRFSPLSDAPTKRTILAIYNTDGRQIEQTSILLERDAPWGTKRRPEPPKPRSDGQGFERTLSHFDDPRLFFHDGRVFVLYRMGPKFGYDDQIQNPLHFDVVRSDEGPTKLVAYVKASETFAVCCGRNIALLSDVFNDGALKAVTWVDPATVIEVDTTPVSSKTKTPATAAKRRRLAESGKKAKKTSNIHGTNGHMIPLASTSEYLGIAHFHRPEDRDTSNYALHGHHYTHAFFTISKEKERESFRLSRVSNEFVFRSLHDDHDAEIIQFASGLDLVGSDKSGQLLVSYGINDCEGASFLLDMALVQRLLEEPVEAGTEIFHLMKTVGGDRAS